MPMVADGSASVDTVVYAQSPKAIWQGFLSIIMKKKNVTENQPARIVGDVGRDETSRDETSRDETSRDTSPLAMAVSKLLRSKTPASSATFVTAGCDPPGYTRIQHFRQCQEWDCGVACLQMVIRWLREEGQALDGSRPDLSPELTQTEKLEREWMLDFADTKSIWTVDIILMLEKMLTTGHTQQLPNHNNTNYLFGSQSWGVNTNHETTGYYENAFSNDSTRVMKRFEEICRDNLPVLCPFHLDFSVVLDLVSKHHCVAIALVDNFILMHHHYVTIDAENASHALDGDVDTYVGHYVIVCGIDKNPSNILEAQARATTIVPDDTTNEHDALYCLAVVNPGTPESMMFVTPTHFEMAWRAKGTDCDIIFVAKHDATRPSADIPPK